MKFYTHLKTFLCEIYREIIIYNIKLSTAMIPTAGKALPQDSNL